MNVAVTGATGFIGPVLVARLAAAGHQVRRLSRRPEHGAIYFDALAKPAPKLLEGCDAVINLAGEPIAERWTPQHKEMILRTRVEGTKAILQAARAAGSVKVLINASAIGIYGDRGEEKLIENSALGEGFVADVCKAWEATAETATQAGIRAAMPRTGIVLHPKGGALQKLLRPFNMGVGGRLGSGRQYMSWIHRDDLVALLLHVLHTSSLTGPVNATAPNPVTNAEFTETLARILGRRARFPVPAFALTLALGEMSSILLGGQRVFPIKALATRFNFTYPTLDAALTHLIKGDA